MDWNRIFIGEESGLFFLEIFLRSVIMFLIVLLALRISGKRELKQLSIFDIAIIIALGSAAGDPMFYKEVSLLQAVVVFVGVFSVYLLIVYIISRSEKAENFIEGEPVYIIKNGVVSREHLDNKTFGSDEFFAELRSMQVTHLGQIRRALQETNGEVSIEFFEDHQVLPGLPIWPELYKVQLSATGEPGLYACSRCGFVKEHPVSDLAPCGHCECENVTWVKAISDKRIT